MSDHDATETAPSPETGWFAAMPLAELPPGSVGEVVVGDAILALVNAGGEVYALDGLCAHQGGPLGRGRLEGCTLTCPWHGWQYDVASGRQLLSERVRQRRYPVRLQGDTIWVRLTEG